MVFSRARSPMTAVMLSSLAAILLSASAQKVQSLQTLHDSIQDVANDVAGPVDEIKG